LEIYHLFYTKHTIIEQYDSTGVALVPKILEPKKSPILICCRQFSNIEAKQNASKNLDNSTNMCDIKLDEVFIVYYYNN